MEIYGWKESDKEKMRLEKSLATLPNSEEFKLDNYKILINSLKDVGNKYLLWVKKCRIHYRKKLKDNIVNYFTKNEEERQAA